MMTSTMQGRELVLSVGINDMARPRLSMKLLWKISDEFTTTEPSAKEQRIFLNGFLNYIEERMKSPADSKKK